MSVVVRDYRPEDAEALSVLYAHSIHARAPGDYSPAQIEVWAGLAPSPERLDTLMADGRRRFVAFQASGPVGFLDLETDGHIHFLYKAPEAEPGVAAQLLAAAEAFAVTAEVARLYAEASEPARRFFERHGFLTVERRDFEVEGVAIHNYAVEKAL